MSVQLNVSAIAIAGQTAWRKAKPTLLQETLLYPALGFLGILLLWWIVAWLKPELMPTPPKPSPPTSTTFSTPFSGAAPATSALAGC